VAGEVKAGGDSLRCDRVQSETRKGRVSLNRHQPNSVEIAPGLQGAGGFCPRSKAFSAELSERHHSFLFAYPHFTLCER
jgi:hypothetical protein